MKRRLHGLHLLLALCAVTTFVRAETEGKLLLVDATDRDALVAAIDQEVIVHGTVTSAEWSGSGKVLNIRFGKAEDTKFQAVAFERQKKKLDESFSGNFIKTITGANVRIVATVQKYGGKDAKQGDTIEVVIAQPSQISIVEKE